MILAAGLSPAWQQIMVLDKLHEGQVNRARTVHWCASGKVLNVGWALHHLHAPSKTLSWVGGLTGQAIRAAFAELPARWIESATPTRVCTTLLDETKQEITELVENAGPAVLLELEAFLSAFEEEANTSEIVVLTGSLPAGAPSDVYQRALKTFRGRAILDVRGPELLESLGCHPFLIKPNREELARTLSQEHLKEDALIEAMFDLNRRGAEWVVVTQGSEPVLATNRGQRYRIPPAHVPPIVNAIGCGDCVAAGIADALHRGAQVLDAIRWGLACAADNLSQLLPARLDLTRVQAAMERLQRGAPIDEKLVV